MGNTKKYYKTKFVIEVLSEDPIPEDMDISQVIEEATTGDYSMVSDKNKEDILTGKEMALALIRQGSSPDLFQLDENGNDINEEEEEDEQG